MLISEDFQVPTDVNIKLSFFQLRYHANGQHDNHHYVVQPSISVGSISADSTNCELKILGEKVTLLLTEV